jgi:hypothetical protein
MRIETIWGESNQLDPYPVRLALQVNAPRDHDRASLEGSAGGGTRERRMEEVPRYLRLRETADD